MKNILVKCCFLLIIAVTGCRSNNTNVSQEKEQKLFKSWIQDTVSVLKRAENNIEIKVGEDSLSLEIIEHYDAKIIISNSTDNNQKIKSIIRLLSEYGELPKTDFYLSFKVSTFYFPHWIKRDWDYVYEIKDLETETNYEKAFYTYIRGRLGGKKIQTKDGNEITYDFIWKDNNLQKVQIK